jgi:hypothetical protein
MNRKALAAAETTDGASSGFPQRVEMARMVHPCYGSS